MISPDLLCQRPASGFHLLGPPFVIRCHHSQRSKGELLSGNNVSICAEESLRRPFTDLAAVSRSPCRSTGCLQGIESLVLAELTNLD